jgi:excisionase family DNA binding protein
MSSGRITVLQIAERLSIGRSAVYTMLEHQIIPAIRLGRRWIITRNAYQQWELCGKDYNFSVRTDCSSG